MVSVRQATRSGGSKILPPSTTDMTSSSNATDNRPEVDLLLRKSKIVREGERALSIRAQEERGRAWAAENGYRVRKVWKENLSAWSDVKRPMYDAAMDAVLGGEVPALWCYALDRFSRKGAEAVVPILGKARVIFDYERLDSMDERDRRWIIDRAENAREYSQRLSYNVRGTKNRQRNEGRWLARAPFGLVPDPDTRRLSPNRTPYLCLTTGRREITPWDVVVRIFKEIAKGVSSRALARKLNAEGICTSTGKTWNGPGVRAVIVHPAYEGWLTLTHSGKNPAHYVNEAGQRVRCVDDNVLPDMIPAETAARARRLLSGHQTVTNTTTPTPGRSVHALTGRVRCAGCGYTMTMDSSSYMCHNHKAGGYCPAPASATRKALETYVVAEWAAQLHSPDLDEELAAALAQRLDQLNRPEETRELREAQAALKAAQAGLDKFHADDKEGFYKGRSARYRMPAKIAAEQAVDTAEDRVKQLAGTGRVSISFLINGQARDVWEAADPHMRRDLLGLAIDTIHITKATKRGCKFDGDKRVTIEWAKPEPTTDDYSEAA